MPTAVNVPVAALKWRLAELPSGQTIVACCRAPYCVYAYEAVEVLREHGMPALRLDGGFLQWRTAGLPVTPGGAKV